MKRLFLGFSLLVAGMACCHSDGTIGPSDLLYKRWQVLQFKRAGENAWIVYNTDAYYDTEYRSDGTLVHRRNGIVMPASCCTAYRFERNGVILQYSNFPICPTVRCTSAAASTITILTENLLELWTNDQITQYAPVN